LTPLTVARFARLRPLVLSDPSGRDVRQEHDGPLLKCVAPFGGRPPTLAWDLHSRIQRIAKWAGRSVTRGGSGNRTSANDAQSNVSTYA